MTPEDRSIFEALENDQLLSLAIYGEARGEPWEGQKAVGSVILNRADKAIMSDKPSPYGNSIKAVILKTLQFSCFNFGDPRVKDDPNFPKLKEFALNWFYWFGHDFSLRECWKCADGLLRGAYPRNTTATNYHASTMAKYPKWANSMKEVAQIGRHIFYA
jgi:spore germination cell wall hydrolase CwlJ-like protein